MMNMTRQGLTDDHEKGQMVQTHDKSNSYEHKNVDKGLWAEVWIDRIFSRWLLNIRP